MIHPDFWTDTSCYSHFEPINRQGAEDEKAFVPCFLDRSPAKFTGKERGSESGPDNFGARYDTPSMGRFIVIDPLFAGRTARHDNALSALCDRWWLVHKIGKIVTVNFFLDCIKQDGFLHGRTPNDVQRTGRNDSIHLDLGVQNPVDTGIRHWSISGSSCQSANQD